MFEQLDLLKKVCDDIESTGALLQSEQNYKEFNRIFYTLQDISESLDNYLINSVKTGVKCGFDPLLQESDRHKLMREAEKRGYLD